MALPILVSVPHAGLRVPPEVASACLLTRDQIVEDGDAHATEIFDFAGDVAEHVTTDVARAIVDLNRAEDDRRPDGVVKSHTCFNAPVYAEPPSDATVERLLERYYRPYHARLTDLAGRGVRVGVDCHTMLAVGPPIGPDPGLERPRVCLSHADGTCPPAWIERLRDCFTAEFGDAVTINDPFTGGHITRTHARELPWVHLLDEQPPGGDE